MQIRNFSIIAHIDHGKSTLADRLMEHTGALQHREMKDQFLDQMDLERERGITIKAQTVRLQYKAKDSQEYQLNLIDTPGHVDFSYEVSRSLSASEGALVVVDASQGVEAQTIANVHLARENGLFLIPVLNKIDLPHIDFDNVLHQIEQILGLDPNDVVLVSAKEGLGIDELLDSIIHRIPSPRLDRNAPLRSLIIDSWYDLYRGVIILIRVFDGEIRTGMSIEFMSTSQIYQVEELGIFQPKVTVVDSLQAGEVGYLIARIKKIQDTTIGDTIIEEGSRAVTPLPGFQEIKPMVFAGVFPGESTRFEDLRDALEKLQLNDSSFTFDPDDSLALGFGFRCGFLGLLHLEIVQERLEREFQLSLISTAPSVVYQVKTVDGKTVQINNPHRLPPVAKIDQILEPYVDLIILTPDDYLGAILALTRDRRGTQQELVYLDDRRVKINFHVPLAEIILDFFDRLKSISRGYASMDYERLDYRQSDLVKLDILINGDPVDALSSIVHKTKSYARGRDLVSRMEKTIPRQMFEVVIQAAIGSHVISRSTVKALRKNVTAKCYGGDITRKRKLLEKQKLGKKRMKQIGKVEIPQEAFLSILKTEN